ncbi:autotransporter assembly complex protein TamA [Rhodospirillaceae bacterium SYSU D60014]|uniref:autotransporter assembly complex protein TamA n=1 Tax=Virgifigura deserti TaxID=2268457 RepID=UPI000E662444
MRRRLSPDHPRDRPRRGAPRRDTGHRTGIRPLLATLLLLTACASDEFEVPEIAAGGPEIPYKTVIEGIENDNLRELLAASSSAVELEDRPPATLTLLEHRGERDTERLRTVLRSEGYYEAEVAVDIDESTKPVRLVYRIDRGPAFRLESVELSQVEAAAEMPVQLPDAADLGLEINSRARAAEIVAAQENLLRRLQQQGFPYPTITERQVVVDRRTRKVRVSYRVDPGAKARFGPTTITGLRAVEEPFVRALIPWQENKPFDIRRFNELRTALLETGLFSTVRIRGADTVPADGVLPVAISLTERKSRTVTAGISYQTEEGPRVEASWEHRNLFGRGEGLQIGASVSAITMALEAGFRKPAFLRPDQALLAEGRLARDDTDAYTSENAQTQVLLERTLRPGMVAAAGVGFKYALVEDKGDDGDKDEFGLVYLPARFRWDTSDDLLDPTRGGRLAADVAPYQDVLGSGVNFVRGSAAYTRYVQVFDEPRIVLAGRGAGGSIIGSERDDIPADERFYVGGGGSVRGFSFQEAGELDDDGDPIGGRSFLELSGELRVKATETLGFVAFIDAGRAFSTVYPDFDEELLVGSGLGFRYFTPIGPLRLDVAVPLNPRDADASFQLYVSIGQAF